MTPTERAALYKRFTATVKTTVERVLAVSDRIFRASGKGKDQRARLCVFSRSLQVRRLLENSEINWSTCDCTVAAAVLEEIKALRQCEQGIETTLALAVLGVETDGLETAIDSLIGKPVAAQATTTITRPERKSGGGLNVRQYSGK